MDGDSQKSGSVAGKKHFASMLFHMGIGVAFLILLVLALVSLGSLAAKHNETLGLCPQYRCGCILFCTRESGTTIQFSRGKSCVFGIWGEAVIAAIAVGFIVLAVVKVATGKQM